MKKFSKKVSYSLSALLPALLLSAQSPLLNAEEEKAEEKTHSCSQCVKYTGWRGVLDFGLGYVSDDALRFADYRGLEEKGVYPAIDGDLHYRNLEGHYFDLYVRDLAHDSRQLELRGGNQGHYELRFAWKEIPKYRGFGTQTPFIGVGSDTLTLPADWVPARTVNDMSALANSLVTARLKTQRKTIDLGATLKFANNWAYRVDFQRQEKKGTRAFGAGLFFNNSTLLPAPVDFSTDQFDMDLSWAGKRAHIQFGFIGSSFNNAKTSLTWQNPFFASPEHQTFRAALEPDNEFYQFNLSAAYAFSPAIRISGEATIGRLSQDDTFLPYTINPSYSELPLPRSSLDGKLDIGNASLGGKFSARINNRLSFNARAKWLERDNKTAVDLFTQVITDLLPIRSRYNRPYSYEREQYSADLRYRMQRNVRLSAGVKQENWERSLQSVEETEEITWWGEAKFNPFISSHLRMKVENSKRDISAYTQPVHSNSFDHPLLRKFNLADRDRRRILVELNLAPISNFSLDLSFFHANDEYENSTIGLQESSEQSFSINMNYALGKKVDLYAFVTLDDIDADITNVSTGISTLWNAATRDQITTAGIGISSRLNERAKLGFDYISSDSKGNVSVQTAAAETPFDPLKTDLSNARVHFDYEVNKHWAYQLFAEYEKYSSRDWAIDGLGVDGIHSILSMGEESPNYSAWYLRVQASYRF